ncbi:YoaK family protein [Bradyrhizobium sp. S3.3.6]|uniref:YoaK family protein n=1 Tax=Bradyrhizobium sp. S3.3.6 TaxID=3156429 RepID=UPI003391B0FC
MTPSVDTSLGMTLLPFVLSVTAGSVDVITFLRLGRLFTAHITGNMVILAAHLVDGGTAPMAPILSVPVFIAVLGLTRLLAAGLEIMQTDSLRPLLALQAVLLSGMLLLCVTAGAERDPNARIMITAGMLGVAAMAVQNALVQISLRGAAPTAVMTSNITRFAMDIGTVVFRRDPRDVAAARNRALHTWPTILGFAVGCGVGAACEAAVGLLSLALPASTALIAFALGFSFQHGGSAG